MKPEDTLCYCFHITMRKVTNYLRIHKPRRASQLSECGGAGTGCGWCVPYLQKCFRQAAEAAPEEEGITAEEYAAGRAGYLLAGKGKARPGTDPNAASSPAEPS